jgi:steroid delta-isomerase-like uncharacterized protein
MTREQVLEFFARQQNHWNRRDATALAEGHAPDGTVVSPIFRTVVGRPGILASYRSLFQIFPDWTLTGEELLVDEERAAQAFSVTATHVGEFMGLPGSGRKFQLQGVRLFTMEGGLIARERRYYDFTGLLIQVGVLRSKPANPQSV